MEHVDELIQPELGGSETPRRRSRVDEDRAPWTWSNPFVRGLFFMQCLVLAGVAGLIYVGLETKVTLGDQLVGTQSIERKTEALSNDLLDLRQFIASKTSEDVIHLKMQILKSDIDPALSSQIAKLIHRYAVIYGQDVDLILAIIYIESQFNPKAVSNKGATGLMQVMPQWQRVLGMSGDLTDPETSLKYGLQILGFYQEMYKDDQMALTAYNRGPGPVDMALMNGKDYKNGYAEKVLNVYHRLQAMGIDQS